MLVSLKSILPALNQLCEREFFFISSIGKSGTTWLQKMVDEHPEASCSGEGKFQKLIDECFLSIDKYNQILDHTNQVIYKNDTYYGLWADGHKVALSNFVIALSLLTKTKAIPTGAKIIGDKDTSYVLRINLWKSLLLPNAKFIHMVRDPRDGFVSNMFHLNRQGENIKLGNEKFLKCLQQWIETWKISVESSRKAYKNSSELYKELKYEDLLANPAEEFKDVCRFLDISEEDSIVRTAVENTSFKKLSGGREQGEESQDSFYRKGVSGDWKNHLDNKSNSLFIEGLGKLLDGLGYDV